MLKPSYPLGSAVESVKNNGLSALLALGILFIASPYANFVLLYYIGGILFLASILSPFVGKWIPQKRVSSLKKAVFISGCDSGFGYLLSQTLDGLGFTVFAGCLFPDGSGACDLREMGSHRMHVIGIDVTSDDSVREAASYVKENLQDNVLWAIVNNAGIALCFDMCLTSMETIRKIIDVNTFGVVRVIKSFIPMLKESKGRILVVTSISGRHTTPGILPYSMSKAAVINMCDGLRLELCKWDIPVIDIQPIIYRTDIVNFKKQRETIIREWEKAPNHLKAMYSANYPSNFEKNLFFKQLVKWTSRDPNELVSAMEDAITAVYPKFCYSPQTFPIWISLWLREKLPKPIATMFEFYVV